MGAMEAPPRHEASGMAFSRRGSDLLWVHDDSGGQAALFALGTDGKLLGSMRLRNLRNEDWEDVAAFTLDGKPWLLVGDIGDNTARRPFITLHLVAEPMREELSPKTPITVPVTWTLRVRYEDGAHDCESVAVDPVERAIYLISKRDNPSRLYSVPFPATPPTSEVAVARRVGPLPHLPAASAAERLVRGDLNKPHSEVTALDFSADGKLAAVLTYAAALIFERRGNEPWAAALAREPVTLPYHGLLQAEALCFSPDGKYLYVAAEGSQPLLRYTRE